MACQPLSTSPVYLTINLEMSGFPCWTTFRFSGAVGERQPLLALSTTLLWVCVCVCVCEEKSRGWSIFSHFCWVEMDIWPLLQLSSRNSGAKNMGTYKCSFWMNLITWGQSSWYLCTALSKDHLSIKPFVLMHNKHNMKLFKAPNIYIFILTVDHMVVWQVLKSEADVEVFLSLILSNGRLKP